ncbi:hypothetical protein RND81_05G160000 [Saponaria officinalis]|uniref:RING-type domain-containing protein n=2 Tax=Saponaria officinalis TaxID=3572 RepID=A0AAW1KYP0_SAPOF
MVSAVCFLLMLLIVIILPTILYTLFFLINFPSNPFIFFRHRSENSGEMGLGSSKTGDQVEDDKNNNKKNNMELVIMSTKLGNDIECPICLTVFVDGEEIKQVKICKHLFHKSCIEKWLSTHFNCPVCRAFISNHFKVKKEDVRGLASTSDLWQGLPDSSGLV